LISLRLFILQHFLLPAPTISLPGWVKPSTGPIIREGIHSQRRSHSSVSLSGHPSILSIRTLVVRKHDDCTAEYIVLNGSVGPPDSAGTVRISRHRWAGKYAGDERGYYRTSVITIWSRCCLSDETCGYPASRIGWSELST
jgi:hypothetical protein